ncbi:D-alanyl-D-alanine carboxypeptidase family protein [Aurantiacibacter suaedae]|uniref:D-alanyl-D-alanine carboxypeptidase family protein n=1 Tax=Aurantiacibacter suaedae TaxID=2545755 RepID=UPI001F5018D1|nr:D-alanyl-D-alanine carboxypeptidase family protein [Aurantiacibacter suaedae]
MSLTAPVRAQPATPAPVPDEIPVALLVDLWTGQQLYAREPHRRFVPASVTKVMTAYTAFKLVGEGKLKLDRHFLYTQALEDEWYAEGSNMFLRAGERPTIGQLLLGITTVSGNDASMAIAEAATGSTGAWLDLMNENAAALGMNDSHFGSPNGYPDGGKTYTTADDLVKLGQAVTQDYPALFHRFFGHRRLKWGDITQANHDPITGQVEGGDGLKTGYTSEAGYTLIGTAARGGRRLIVVLAGSPTARMRDAAGRNLIDWGFREFSPTRLFAAGSEMGRAQVQDGTKRSVGLALDKDFAAALPADPASKMGLTISYRGPVEAPIAKGDTVARLQLRNANGTVVVDAPLLATEAVPKAGLLRRIGNAFAKWFG